MAKLGTTNIGGGGGIGSDELSVTADKVIEGYTYVGADTDDEIGDGTIPSKGSSTASQSVTTSGSNLVTRIPNGAYITNALSGYPEITSSLSSIASVGGLTSAKLLSGQTALGISGTATSDATATAAHILSGQTAWVNGSKLTGNMPNYSTTPTSINAIRINNNRFEVAVAFGYHGQYWDAGGYEYMSFDQVANAIGLTPEKLKKGEWVCGRTGTFEGYVPGAIDLYYRGNNVAGWTVYTGTVYFEAGQITLDQYSNSIRTNVNTVGRNYINIQGYRNMLNTGTISVSYLNPSSSWTSIGSATSSTNGDYTHSISVSAYQTNATFRITFEGFQPAVYRIWLS